MRLGTHFRDARPIMTRGIRHGRSFRSDTDTERVGLSDDASVSPGLLTILLFVPIANLYAWYKYAELYETASRDHMNRWVLFLLALVFMPAVWFIVQTELNKRARGSEQALSVAA
jgi:hypothetical protein